MMSIKSQPIVQINFQPEMDNNFEELEEMSNIVWMLYDGKKFSREIYKNNIIYSPEELNEIISYNHATITWNDNYGWHTIPLKTNVISITNIINTIISFYKKHKITPSICFYTKAFYNPFTKVIKLHFAHLT